MMWAAGRRGVTHHALVHYNIYTASRGQCTGASCMLLVPSKLCRTYSVNSGTISRSIYGLYCEQVHSTKEITAL